MAPLCGGSAGAIYNDGGIAQALRGVAMVVFGSTSWWSRWSRLTKIMSYRIVHRTGCGAPRGLRQAAVGADVVVLLAHDDDGLSEQSDHQRVTTVRNRRDDVDEMPPGPVGRGHLAPEDPIVRRDGHAPVPAGEVCQPMSFGAFFGATIQPMSPDVPP